MTKTPADRLKAMRESRGYTTAKDAADAFGWNPVTYRSHENGVRNIPYGAAQKYGAAYGVKAAAILSGEDSGPQPIVNSVINVGLVGTVSAGVFREGNGLEDMEILVPAVPRSDIPASAQYCVRVDGPSVNLRIPDGAYAICARFESYPGGAVGGELVHVERTHAGLVEHTIKQLKYERSGAFLMPLSSDPRYQEKIKFEGDQEFNDIRIAGVVIGVFQTV